MIKVTLRGTILFIISQTIAFASIAQKATIPFQLYDERIHIDLKTANGASFDFMFDTGAESCVFEKELAAESGFAVKGESFVMGAVGRQSLSFTKPQTFYLSEDMKVKKVSCYLVELKNWRNRTGRDFYGIIGKNVLVKYVTKIDFDSSEIAFYNRLKEVDLTDYRPLKFTFHNGLKIPQFNISVQLNNGDVYVGRVLFDTGAGLTLSINKPFAVANDLGNAVGKTIAGSGGGLNKRGEMRKGMIAGLSIAGFNLGEMMIQLPDADEGVASYSGYLGILGNEVIKRFNIVLDYANRTLYLKPNQNFETAFPRPLSGIKLSKTPSGIIIDEILKDTNAYRAGLRPGDYILAIGEESGGDLYAYKQLLDSKPGPVQLRIKNTTGDEMSVNFELEPLL